MTSYKNVMKYDYTQTPADVVALCEYMLFDDGKENGKYAVLKFSNNLDQKLYAIQFEVLQYNDDGGLIAKKLIVYDRFTADPGETFVPKAKLALSAQCARISIKLLSARFDRVRWEKGSFSADAYSFRRYVRDEGLVNAKAAAPDKAAAAAKEPPQKKSYAKTAAFRCSNIYRENMAVFPQVFAVFMVLVVLGFAVGTGIWLRRTSSEFSIGEFDVIKLTDETVSVVGYDGKDKHVAIPAKIGNYKVTKIGKGAFKKSDILSVTIEGEYVIVSARAFDRCKRLTAVYSGNSGTVQVLAHAFENCTAIKEIVMRNAVVAADGFYGSHNVVTLRIGRTTADNVQDIFGENEV